MGEIEIGMGTKGRQDARSSFALGIWKSHKQIAGCADRSHPDQGRPVQNWRGFFWGGLRYQIAWLGLLWGEPNGRRGQGVADLIHSLCVISELLNAFVLSCGQSVV